MHLSTCRLELREYAPDDLAAFVAYQADPRMRQFRGEDEGPERWAALLQTFLAWARASPRRNWQLALALRGKPLELRGSCGLRERTDAPGSAEFGLELTPDLWGRGYATEAATAIFDFGFGDLNLESVRGHTVSGNVRVERLVRRLGFQPVGSEAGPAWLADRGWTRVWWRLDRAGWMRCQERTDQYR
jgi:ribosomal-protein-alanine N-acetyltransferase